MSTALARFSGRVAVVTGAAQGVGYACAERIGQEGGRIVIADVAEGPAREAVEMLRGEGIEARAACADLAQSVAADEVMALARREFGRLDVVVNNVGGTIWKKPFWHYSPDEIRQEVERSFWPMLWTAYAAVRAMHETGGVIVNIGSNAVDGVFRVPYSACKGAVAALTTALAAETAELKIRVNCVALGGTTAPERKTPRLARALTPQEQEWETQFLELIGDEDLMGRFSTAQEQAAVVAFLASDDASHVTGEIINTGRRGRRMFEYLEKKP